MLFYSVLLTNAEEGAINSMATLVKMLGKVQWPSFFFWGGGGGIRGSSFICSYVHLLYMFLECVYMRLYECLNMGKRLYTNVSLILYACSNDS